MAAIIPFRVKRNRQRTVSTPLFPAVVKVYPLVRYAGEVDRLARQMRSLATTAQRADAMVRHVTHEWNRLCDFGADEAATQAALVAFANAVWAEVSRIERGGVA